MITVTLFTKPGCGLCDEVKAELDALQPLFPHQLSQVDISQESALFEKYRYIIPVVQIGNVELMAPITAVQLQQTLAEISQQTASSG
ncbi:MAG: glutaredoxin family protein [Anaerolineae bacterium]|jgi:glutaredoxin|nr:glutaredoxin family protein [Anaerolineae bacterium]